MPSGMVPEGFFNAFRTNGAPTYYGPNQTPWETDIVEAGFIFAFVILAISFFVVLPGIRGKEVSIRSWNINVIKRFLTLICKCCKV